MDARHIASVTTKVRETLMAALLNGTAEPAALAAFPCPAATLTAFPAIFKQKYPSATSSRVIGGLGKHYDLETVNGLTPTPIHSELKVTMGNPSPLEQLSWRPWQDTVQFLQGQLKSKIGKRFLGDCGEPMVRAWFEKRIQPAYPTMTFKGYEKAMSTIGMKGKQEAAAVDFINSLRADAELKTLFHAYWLAFEADWLSEHQMDHAALKEVVKDIIEAKDAWICVSKTAVNLIEGLKVADLKYVGAKEKPRGGMSFHYTIVLTRGGETKEVPMECKFHWKNGGQAVQNLNFMLL